MITYPISLSPTPALTDEGTLESAIDCLTQHLPLAAEGTYTAREIFEILVRAASRGDSIEHTTRALHGSPSSNSIRYHLDKFDDMELLEAQLNNALQSRIPTKVKAVPQRMAITSGRLRQRPTPDSLLWHPNGGRSPLRLPFTSKIWNNSLFRLCHDLCRETEQASHVRNPRRSQP